MIKAISAGAANPSFRNSVLPRRLYARPFGLQSRRLQERDHFLTERRVSIEDGIRYGPASGNASRSCWTTHSAVGWSVTLKRRIRRRPCSITKKAVKQQLECHRRAVKKSNAAITSRWFCKNVSQVLAGSPRRRMRRRYRATLPPRRPSRVSEVHQSITQRRQAAKRSREISSASPRDFKGRVRSEVDELMYLLNERNQLG